MNQPTNDELTCAVDTCTRLPENATICEQHEHQLRTWLRETPERYALLPAFIEHGTTDRNPDAKTARNVDAPAPMRLEVLDLLDDRLGRKWQGIAVTDERRGVVGTLNAWANEVRDAKRIAPATTPTVSGEAHLLSLHVAWIVQQDWAADLHTEIRDLHRRLGDAIGIHRQRPVGSCPVDDGDGPCGVALYPSQFGGVRCRSGHGWDIDELRRLGLLIGTPA